MAGNKNCGSENIIIMKKILFLLFIEVLLSCGSSNTEVTGAEEYIKTISGFTSEKAIVTDNGMLIIVIDAVSDKGMTIRHVSSLMGPNERA